MYTFTTIIGLFTVIFGISLGVYMIIETIKVVKMRGFNFLTEGFTDEQRADILEAKLLDAVEAARNARTLEEIRIHHDAQNKFYIKLKRIFNPNFVLDKVRGLK